MEIIIAFSLIGVAFFTYSLLCCMKRKVIYTIKDSEFIVIDNRYFNLQLKVSIINSIILACGGILSQVSQLGKIKSSAPFIALIIFWIINYTLRWIAISKKYAQLKKAKQ